MEATKGNVFEESPKAKYRKQQATKTFADLPLEILTKIFHECSAKDKLKNISLVCGKFKTAVDNPAAWSHITEIQFSGYDIQFGVDVLCMGFDIFNHDGRTNQFAQSVGNFVENNLKNVKHIAFFIAFIPTHIKQIMPQLIVNWKKLEDLSVNISPLAEEEVYDFGPIDEQVHFLHDLFRQVAASAVLSSQLELIICIIGTDEQYMCESDLLFKQTLPLALKCPIEELILNPEMLSSDYSKEEVVDMFRGAIIRHLDFDFEEDLLFVVYADQLAAAINQLQPHSLKTLGRNGRVCYDHLKSECGISKFLSAIDNSQLSGLTTFTISGQRVDDDDESEDHTWARSKI